ncbi:MAG: hypothetical protein JWM66_1597 [Solirubrobacterales bacterium]|jgi:hypothetical protein|nr:hypothetical protein [Solirubrobacterales bacterium]
MHYRGMFMTSRRTRAAIPAIVLTLACASAAFAAGPLKGRTYQGSVPSMGVDREGHRVRTHATGSIALRVASDGRSVTIRFSSAAAVLYCVSQERIHVQTTKSATIAKSGKFSARIDERFAAGPGAPSIVQVVTGQFTGGAVRGQIHTQAPPCSGTSSFSASAH